MLAQKKSDDAQNLYAIELLQEKFNKGIPLLLQALANCERGRENEREKGKNGLEDRSDFWKPPDGYHKTAATRR